VKSTEFLSMALICCSSLQSIVKNAENTLYIDPNFGANTKMFVLPYLVV